MRWMGWGLVLAGLVACSSSKRVRTVQEELREATAELSQRTAELAEAQAELGERLAALEQKRLGLADPEAEAAAGRLLQEATTAFEQHEVARARRLLDQLADDYGATRAARAGKRMATELAVVGREELDLAGHVANWYQGSPADRGDRATLYVFWEVWCPHCKREVPRLQGEVAEYDECGIGIVALTKQTRQVSDAQVRDFIERHGLTFAVAREEGSALSDHYGVRGIPAATLVADGEVIWRGHPARLSTDLIDELVTD